MISLRSASRASSTLTKEKPVPLHCVYEGGDLTVAQAVGAAVGDQAGGGGGDGVEDHEVVLAEGGASRRQVHDAVGEANERGELYGAAERDDLRLTAHPLEVPPRRTRVLGRHSHDLRVPDSLLDSRGLLGRCRQDHAAPTRPQLFELHDVRLLLLEDVLAGYTDVRRPVLDV